MKVIPPTEMAALLSRRQPWISPGVWPVVMPGDEFAELRFCHHLTEVFARASRGKTFGRTCWVALTDDARCVVLTFDWARSASHPVLTADLLSIASNAHVVDDEGNVFGEHERFIVLSERVCGLQWQGVVGEHISTLQGV